MSSYPFETIGAWPHAAMVVVLVCPHFRSPRYILGLSPSWCPHIPVFTSTCCIYYCSTDSRSILFPVERGGSSWNVWELAIGEKWSIRSERRKRKHALGWYGRDCHTGIWRGLPALGHDSGDIKALWSRSTYRYVLLLYIVDNARRHYIDFGREGLLNDLGFFNC